MFGLVLPGHLWLWLGSSSHRRILNPRRILSTCHPREAIPEPKIYDNCGNNIFSTKNIIFFRKIWSRISSGFIKNDADFSKRWRRHRCTPKATTSFATTFQYLFSKSRAHRNNARNNVADDSTNSEAGPTARHTPDKPVKYADT